MTNVYKAVAFMTLNDPTTRGSNSTGRKIASVGRRTPSRTRSRGAEQAQVSKPANFDDTIEKAQQSSEYASATQHLGELAAYTPFENPFATYLGGVFFS